MQLLLAGLGGIVQESVFFELLEEVFGRSLGHSIFQDQKLHALHNLTAQEALKNNYEPHVVWNVLCDHMEIPDSERWGKEHVAPPFIKSLHEL